jgi:hypothetical protein
MSAVQPQEFPEGRVYFVAFAIDACPTCRRSLGVWKEAPEVFDGRIHCWTVARDGEWAAVIGYGDRQERTRPAGQVWTTEAEALAWIAANPDGAR